MAELPTGYVLRAPAQSDASAVVAVVQAHDIADFGEPDFSEADLLDDWMRPRFVLESDSWVLTGPTGRIVGYAYVWESHVDRELEADAYVLPEYAGRGLGGQLLDLVETRARAVAAGRPMRLGVFASRVNDGKRSLLERRGFTFTRTVLRMRADLTRAKLDPVDPPPGVTIAPLVAADRVAVRAVWKEAFSAHGRFSPRGMDEWLDTRFGHPAFEPSLCQVARAGDEVVGAIIAFDVRETGYTSSVALRPDVRGQGVGPALVRAAFAALADRGQMRVLVSLDADADSGLQAMYEAAGMRVHERHDLWVKVLG